MGILYSLRFMLMVFLSNCETQVKRTSMMTLPPLFVLVLRRLIFDLLPLFIFFPSFLSRLPLSCSHSYIGRRASDMWHSDICHLLFAPADDLYKFTKRLERSCSLLCAFTHHIQGAHSGLFLSVFFFFYCGR